MDFTQAKKLKPGDRVIRVNEPDTPGTIRHLTWCDVEILWDDGWYGGISYTNMDNIEIYKPNITPVHGFGKGG